MLSSRAYNECESRIIGKSSSTAIFVKKLIKRRRNCGHFKAQNKSFHRFFITLILPFHQRQPCSVWSKRSGAPESTLCGFWFCFIDLHLLSSALLQLGTPDNIRCKPRMLPEMRKIPANVRKVSSLNLGAFSLIMQDWKAVIMKHESPSKSWKVGGQNSSWPSSWSRVRNFQFQFQTTMAESTFK